VYSAKDCALLVERIGSTAAKEVLLTGRIFGLDDAMRLGLVDRVAPSDATQQAHALATEIAGNAPLSVMGNKTILNAIANGSAEGRLPELNALIAQAFDSSDYREGQLAFAERRAPQFTGR